MANLEVALDARRMNPDIRVVRMRTGLVFKAGAAASVTRRFLGPWVPNPLLRKGLIPMIPRNERLAGQAMHAEDAGHAYHLAISGDVRGAFNVAAEPVLNPEVLARVLRARPVGVSARLLRGAAAAAHHARVIRADPGWIRTLGTAVTEGHIQLWSADPEAQASLAQRRAQTGFMKTA